MRSEAVRRFGDFAWHRLRGARVAAGWSLLVVGSVLGAVPNAKAQSPYTRSSPSGSFTFEVDPDADYGEGPADCRLLASGHEVWAKRIPFTFEDAAVTDAGIACGYGYSRARRHGDLIVASLGPTGELRREWRTPCLGSRGPDGPERPIVSGMLVEPDLDRFGLRIEDANEFGKPALWLFALSDGRRLDVVWPDESLRGTPWTSGNSIRRSHELFGKSLRLVQWQSLLRGGEPTRRFVSLVDSRYRLVWTLPSEARAPLSTDPTAIEGVAFDSGTILDVTADGRFTLGFDDLRKQIEFAAEKDLGARLRWRVKELARSDYAPPEPLAIGDTRANLPELRLDEHGSFALGGRFDATHFSWIDAGGRVFLLDPSRGAVLAFDSAGKQRFVADSQPKGAKRGDDDFDLRDPILVSDEAGGILVDSGSNAREPRKLRRFDALGKPGAMLSLGRADRATATRAPGTFWIAINGEHKKLALLDSSGTEIRNIDPGTDRSWLWHVSGLCVDPEDTLVGVSNEHLLFVDATSDTPRVVPLPAARDGVDLRCAASRDYVVVGGGHRIQVLVHRRTDGAWFTLPRRDVEYGTMCSFGFDSAGEELLELELPASVVRRYSLPRAR